METQQRGNTEYRSFTLQAQKSGKQYSVERLQYGSAKHLEGLNPGTALRKDDQVSQPTPLFKGFMAGVLVEHHIRKCMIGDSRRCVKVTVGNNLNEYQGGEGTPV
jgi:hypothetical protein